MKKLVKLVNINDGNKKEVQNDERLYIETYPRAEKIISGFLNRGWELTSRTQRFYPAIQEKGKIAFYLGGWDVLFEKEVDDDAEDDGDEILEEILSEVLGKADPEEDEYGFDEDDLEYDEDEFDFEEEE